MTWYENVVSPFAPMSDERRVPTSQPRCVAAALRERAALRDPHALERVDRARAVGRVDAGAAVGPPRVAGDVLARGREQDRATALRPRLQRRRSPAGSAPCTPAAAGAAMLVPLIVSFDAVTPVPFAAISGSSRSLCAGRSGCGRPSRSPSPRRCRRGCATVRLLKPLWLTNSVLEPLPAACRSSGTASGGRASPCTCRRTRGRSRSARSRGGSSG